VFSRLGQDPYCVKIGSRLPMLKKWRGLFVNECFGGA
jgi:hypothetical protein